MRHRKFFGKDCAWGWRFRWERQARLLFLDLGPFFLDLELDSDNTFILKVGR